MQKTGREQADDVIAYQVRQAFKPDEITPELANKIGYELAEKNHKRTARFYSRNTYRQGSYTQSYYMEFY